MKFNPEYIIIHHSATVDGKVNDWKAIERYHTSYRYKGDIITKATALKLQGNGVKGVVFPWSDIGYRAGVEMLDGVPVIQEGRPEGIPQAHCKEKDMNYKSYGFCFIGNYDLIVPSTAILEKGAQYIADMLKRYNIPLEHVEPHRKYTPKSCPGLRFNMDLLKETILKFMD